MESVISKSLDRSEKYRSFYAKLICTAAKLDDPRIEDAFRFVKRELFAGPGPWSLTIGAHPYVQTPDDDPAFLYQDVLIALDRERRINLASPAPTRIGWEPAGSRSQRPWCRSGQEAVITLRSLLI